MFNPRTGKDLTSGGSRAQILIASADRNVLEAKSESKTFLKKPVRHLGETPFSQIRKDRKAAAVTRKRPPLDEPPLEAADGELRRKVN